MSVVTPPGLNIAALQVMVAQTTIAAAAGIVVKFLIIPGMLIP